jgi:hypothetical protein
MTKRATKEKMLRRRSADAEATGGADDAQDTIDAEAFEDGKRDDGLLAGESEPEAKGEEDDAKEDEADDDAGVVPGFLIASPVERERQTGCTRSARYRCPTQATH